jgi:hypothetical protein
MTCWDQTQREHPVPFFEILWGPLDEKSASYRVKILIDGRTKELVHLRLEDESLSRRPKDLVRNRKALLEITDEEFLAYSEEEKQNLVRRFSAAAGALPKENGGGTTTNSPSTPPTPARLQP